MSYLGNSPGVASQRVESAFTATASQTVFTPTSGYTLGYCDVYLNGIKLVNGDDYTASNGTSITLATAAAAGDSVVIVASFPRGLSDGYLKAEADAKYVAKTGSTMTGDLVLDNGNADGAQLQLASSGSSNWNLDNYSGRLRAYYGSTEYFTVNANGMVGVSVAPGAWTSAAGKGLQINNVGNTIWANGAGGLTMSANATYNSGWVYTNTSGSAARFDAGNGNGTFSWGVASGTGKNAGDALAWSTVLTLGNSGRLTLTPTGGQVSAPTGTDMTAAAGFSMSLGGGDYFSIGQMSGSKVWMQAAYGANPSLAYYDICMQPNGGNLLVGTTSAGGKLCVDAKSGSPAIYASGSTSFTAFSMVSRGDIPDTIKFADVDIGGQGLGGSYFQWVRGGSYDNALNLWIRASNNTTANRFQFDSGGNAYKSSGSGSWSALSDIRVKTNVTPVTGGLARVLQLNPVTFDYKSPSAHQDKEHDKGFIANEFMLVYPDSVSECEFIHDDDKQYFEEGEKAKALSFNAEFYADLVSAIKELSAQVDAQAAEIAALKGAQA